MATIMALTDDGRVQEVTPLDAEQLRRVALWLCEDVYYHDRLEKTSTTDRQYEDQVDARGYCDDCRRLAAEMVARFDVKERA